VLFQAVSALVVPLLILGSAEAGLRLAGYGHPTSFFIESHDSGRRALVDNTWFGFRFFPPALARSPAPVVLDPAKPRGTCRIFLFGESAALGDPRPAFGPGRYLEVLLRERFPTRDFEVVCVAMTAINSHALLPIARECTQYAGDLWVVYTGNNEMVGPFGANTVFGPRTPPLAMVRARLALERLRIAQGLGRLLRGMMKPPSAPDDWGGLRMFLDHPLPLDDPGRRRVYENFRRNLSDLVQTGCRAGIPVLLSSVASNLKDCAPFASIPAAAAATPHTHANAPALEGIEHASKGRWAEAASHFRVALAQNPQSAELHFRLGRSLLTLGDTDAARGHLEQARDLDLLPFRADSTINGLIAQTARQYSREDVAHVDAIGALTGEGAASIPGGECFYEHVHLKPEGNYRLARVWAEAMVPWLSKVGATPQPGAWAAAETCDRRLGLSDWNRHAALEEMLRRLQDAPFTNQLNHAGQVDRLRLELAATRDRMNKQDPRDLQSFYGEAIQARPQDPWLHHNYAEYLKESGDLAAAASEMQRVRDLIPHHYSAYLQWGRLLARLKRYPEARTALNEAMSRRPDLADAPLELAQVAAGERRYEEALGWFDEVIRRRPRSPGLRLQRADVLMALKRRDEALQSLRDALQIAPSFAEARFHLGIELAKDAKLVEAETELAEVVRLQPGHVLARLNLGNLRARRGGYDEALVQFREVLRLDPSNPTAKAAVAELEPRVPAGSRP